MQLQKKQNKSVILNLPGSITLSNNSSLIKKFIKLLDSGYEKIVIELSTVEKIDLASLQILLSFYRESIGKKIDVLFSGTVNENLKKQLENCGFLIKNINNDLILFPFIEGKGAKIGHR